MASYDRISKSAGWAQGDKLPKGPNGRNLCRWCQKEVGKGRRTFCSDECVDQHKIRSDPGHVRKLLFQRDVGVCAECRADPEALRHELRKSYPQPRAIWGLTPEQRGVAIREAYAQAKTPVGFQGLGVEHTWWHADHIVPVVEGGGQCGLEGYRTLCVPCHRQVTKELRARLAAAKRALK